VDAHLLAGDLDEVGADPVPDAARAAVEEEPDAVGLVEADLDEVAPGAERREVARGVVAAVELGTGVEDRPPARLEDASGLADALGRVVPGSPVVPAAGVGAPVGDGRLDRRPKRREVRGGVARGERREGRRHAAADVDADGGRDDRLDGRDHGAGGDADPDGASGIAAIQRKTIGREAAFASCLSSAGSRGTASVHAFTGTPLASRSR